MNPIAYARIFAFILFDVVLNYQTPKEKAGCSAGMTTQKSNY